MSELSYAKDAPDPWNNCCVAVHFSVPGKLLCLSYASSPFLPLVLLHLSQNCAFFVWRSSGMYLSCVLPEQCLCRPIGQVSLVRETFF